MRYPHASISFRARAAAWTAAALSLAACGKTQDDTAITAQTVVRISLSGGGLDDAGNAPAWSAYTFSVSGCRRSVPQKSVRVTDVKNPFLLKLTAWDSGCHVGMVSLERKVGTVVHTLTPKKQPEATPGQEVPLEQLFSDGGNTADPGVLVSVTPSTPANGKLTSSESVAFTVTPRLASQGSNLFAAASRTDVRPDPAIDAPALELTEFYGLFDAQTGALQEVHPLFDCDIPRAIDHCAGVSLLDLQFRLVVASDISPFTAATLAPLFADPLKVTRPSIGDLFRNGVSLALDARALLAPQVKADLALVVFRDSYRVFVFPSAGIQPLQ